MGTPLGEWNQNLRCIEVDLTGTTGIEDVVTVVLPNIRPADVSLTRVIDRESGAPQEVPLSTWENCGPDGRAFVTILSGGEDAFYRFRARFYKGTCAEPGDPENDTSTPTKLVEPTRSAVAHWIWDAGIPDGEVNIVIMTVNDEET